MIRLRLRELLVARKVSGYRLAKDAGLDLTTIYRLTRKGGRFVRIEAETIDAICTVLGVEPGDLFTR